MKTELEFRTENGRYVMINPAYIVWVEGSCNRHDPETVVHTMNGDIKLNEAYSNVLDKLRQV